MEAVKTTEVLEKKDKKKLDEKMEQEKEKFEFAEADALAILEELMDELSDDTLIAFARMRYKGTDESLKSLACQMREANDQNNKELRLKLTEITINVMKERKWAVLELRKLGEIVKDRWISDSAR